MNPKSEATLWRTLINFLAYIDAISPELATQTMVDMKVKTSYAITLQAITAIKELS